MTKTEENARSMQTGHAVAFASEMDAGAAAESDTAGGAGKGGRARTAVGRAEHDGKADKTGRTRAKAPSGPSRQGRRIALGRKLTLAAVFVAVIASLAFDSGIGTPSSFGVGEFFLLCPLGGIEAMIASRSFLPVSLISIGVIVVFTLVFGRAWCSWGCPAPAIRSFFGRQPDHATCGSRKGCSAAREAWTLAKSLRHMLRDRRTWALACVLVATFVAGLPLFCLVCPIGLTFGTVGSLWHLFVDKQVTLSCLVFPAALVVELVLYRKWCLNLCPVAGLLNVFGQFAFLFRPKIDASTCLQHSSHAGCTACLKACPEHIDLHAPDAALQLADCTRCGECVRQCPTASVSIKAAADLDAFRGFDA